MEKIEDPDHIIAENIQYESNTYTEIFAGEFNDYPEASMYACGELVITPNTSDFVNSAEEIITVYRGDSGENLEDFDYGVEKGSFVDNNLFREFPIYTTTSEDEALEQTDRKEADELFLIELNFPFSRYDRIRDLSPCEIATQYRGLDISDSQLYFNQPNGFQYSLEWISSKVPEEWVEDIRKL